jgi:hypothetical protein
VNRTALVPAILAVGLLAGACSGGGSDMGVASLDDGTQAAQESPPQPSDGSVESALSEEESVLAFAACLRNEGIDVEDPTVDADGNLLPPRPRDVSADDREAMQAAFSACGEYLDNVAFGLNDDDRAEREDQLIAYAACMRDNGYDMPDPDLSSPRTPGQGGGGPFGLLDRDDPAFQTAQDACSGLFAGGPVPGSGPGPG